MSTQVDYDTHTLETILSILDRVVGEGDKAKLVDTLKHLRALYKLGALGGVPVDPWVLYKASALLKASQCYYWHGGKKIAVKRVATLARFMADNIGREVVLRVNRNPRKPPGKTALLTYCRLGVHAGELQLWAVVAGREV